MLALAASGGETTGHGCAPSIAQPLPLHTAIGGRLRLRPEVPEPKLLLSS